MLFTIKQLIQKYRIQIYLCVVILTSFILYAIGFTWGQTSIFQPDEGKLVEPLREMVESKSLIHYKWAYPAEASSKVLGWMLIIINKFIKLDAISYYFANRLFYAFIGAGSVLLTWVIVKKARTAMVAMVTAILMGLCPIWVIYTKQVTGDIPALFFSLLVMLMAQYYLQNSETKYLVAMSFFAACATLEKWNGAWICFYIAFIVILNTYKKFIYFMIDGAIALVAYLCGIIIISPNIAIDVQGLIDGIVFTYVYDGTKKYPLISAYPQFFFAHVGILTVIVMLFGIYNAMLLCVQKKDSESGNLNRLSCCAVYSYSFISLLVFWVVMTRVAFERWGWGIYWGMLLLIAEGLCYFIEHKNECLKLIGYVGGTLILLCFLSGDIRIDTIAANSYKDSRLAGEKVLRQIGATTENTLSDYYSVYCPGGIRVDGQSECIDYNDDRNSFAEIIDGVPMMKVQNIKYVVIGEGALENKKNKGYDTISEHAKLITKVESKGTAFNLFGLSSNGGIGLHELDIIRRNFLDIIKIMNADIIGPSFTVYDVSEFGYID